MEALIITSNILIVIVGWQFVITEYPLTAIGSLYILVTTFVRATIHGLEGL
jgi:hypothetical protein